AAATLASTSAVAGLYVSNVPPSDGATKSLLMNSRVSLIGRRVLPAVAVVMVTSTDGRNPARSGRPGQQLHVGEALRRQGFLDGVGVEVAGVLAAELQFARFEIHLDRHLLYPR